MKNVILELIVLRSLWNTSFLCRPHIALIIIVYHIWIQLFCFLLAYNIMAELKLEHIQVPLLMSS
jgi:hypothetical protein